jgi:hypothetical protein
MFIKNRYLIHEDNPNNDQISTFFSIFYSNFNYMVQTLTKVRQQKRLFIY